jgi:hypothetical protein
MKRVLSALTTAMSLALTALGASSASADDAQQIWSARPSGLRISSELGGAHALTSPLLNGSDPANASGVVFNSGGRISLSAGFGNDQLQHDGLATLPWCAETSGLLRIGAFGRDCLMQGTVQLELPGRVASASTAATWRGERFDLSLAYGFSWLTPDAEDTLNVPYAPVDLRLSANSGAQPLLPGMSGDAHGVGMNSQWRLTAASAVQLNAALQQLRLRRGVATPVFDLHQAMLDVGMNYGPFSGNVTGRVNRLNEQPGYPNAYWSGVDIGVSWRTPWRGELTVGARNVVSKVDDENASATAAQRALDETSARTPYVRYKQDL